MKYSSFAPIALFSSSALAYYANDTTVYQTVTDYTTYCPIATTLTVTKCENHHCTPTEVTVETPSTVTITGEVLCPSTEGGATGGPTTIHSTVTDYTTYCPLSTTITLTKCEHDNCYPTTVTGGEGETITVTGTFVCDTTSTPASSAAPSAAPSAPAPAPVPVPGPSGEFSTSVASAPSSEASPTTAAPAESSELSTVAIQSSTVAAESSSPAVSAISEAGVDKLTTGALGAVAIIFGLLI